MKGQSLVIFSSDESVKNMEWWIFLPAIATWVTSGGSKLKHVASNFWHICCGSKQSSGHVWTNKQTMDISIILYWLMNNRQMRIIKKHGRHALE